MPMKQNRRFEMHGSLLAAVLALAFASAFTAACTVSVDQTVSAIRECEDSVCGHNNPWYNDRMQFGQLALTGEVNGLGVALEHFESPSGEALTLDIVDGGLVGIDDQGDAVLEGSAAVGSRIVLRAEGESTRYEIVVRGFDRQGTRLNTDDRKFPRYLLSAGLYGDDSSLVAICDEPEAGLIDVPAFVLMGERYSPDGRAVITPAPAPWFNFVCQNRALAEMKNLGYDPELRADDPYFTTPEQRVATLRMITADYFGDGVSFTEAGTSIFWQNRAGSVTVGAPPVGAPEHIEAAWDENGATCIGTPRLSSLAAIAAHAEATGQEAPPACPTGITGADLFASGRHWVTWAISP